MFLFISTSIGANQQTIKVGIYENAPKIFTSKTGEPSGIFVDIIKDIAAKEGWTIQYVPGSWDEGLARLTKGEIDLMPDVAYTDERELTMSFHKIPVLSSWSQVFARKGSNIQSILDLNGKRIAVLDGSVQQKAFAGFAQGFGMKTTLIALPSYEAVLDAVVKGTADAAITNNFYGLMHARDLNIEDTAIVFNPSSLFFAATKDIHQDILDAIDKNLKHMKADPKSGYFHSISRWTSEEVNMEIPLWIKVLGLIIAVALIVSLIEALILKKQVALRTNELKQKQY